MSNGSDILQAQMDALYKDIGGQPKNLFLRCVQFAAGTLSPMEVSATEAAYLVKNGIAEIRYGLDREGDRVGSDTVNKFLPPWKAIFTDLAEEMKAMRPSKPRKIAPGHTAKCE